ncbi:hypothetical protein [Blastococcus jejuensis]
MPRIQLLWVNPPRSMQGWDADTHQGILDQGWIAPSPADRFPGPPGRYNLIPEEHWRTVTVGHGDPQVPIFLHESWESRGEKWVQSIPDAADEVAMIAKVRDAVMKLVDSRLAANPAAFPAGPTVTSTEPTPAGIAVIGRCVVLEPTAG